MIDFDSQKDLVNRFGARMQSTLITFKGDKEEGRSVGDTKRDFDLCPRWKIDLGR